MPSIPLDELGAPNAGTTWKGEYPGDVIDGEIVYAGIFQGLDFEQKVTQRKLRVDLATADGSLRTLYAVMNSDINAPDGYADRMARAITTAVSASGAKALDDSGGARLTLQRQADVPPTKPGLNPARDYVARYTPPPAGINLQGAMAAPAPNNVVQFPPQAAQVPQAPQVAPLVAPQAAPAPPPLVAPQVPQAAPLVAPPPVQAPAPEDPNAALAAYLGIPVEAIRVMTPEQVQAMVNAKAAGQ